MNTKMSEQRFIKSKGRSRRAASTDAKSERGLRAVVVPGGLVAGAGDATEGCVQRPHQQVNGWDPCRNRSCCG